MGDATMVAQRGHPLGQFDVVGGHRAPLAPAAKILAWVKAEAAGRADRSSTLPAVARPNSCAVSLAGVLDQMDAVRIGYLAQLDCSRGCAIQMDRQYRLRPAVELSRLQVTRQRTHTHVAGLGFDIDKCGPRTGLTDRG